MKSPLLSFKLAPLFLMALAFPALSTAQGVIQMAATPYVSQQPNIKFGIASRAPVVAAATMPSVPAASSLGLSETLVKEEPKPVPVPLILFDLRPSDRSVKNAFARWAEESKQQVVWRLAGDLPMDASGPVRATSLADAMTQVAASFSDKPEPFVIRQYDNALVVMSRWTARP